MGRGKRPATGPTGGDGGRGHVGGFSSLFRTRGPVQVTVQWRDGEPVGFRRRAARRAPVYRIVDVHERWEEDSPWPFPSPRPVGGDRLRCWRVRARPADEPDAPGTEFVLRMRAGPGVWDLVHGPGATSEGEGGRT